MFILKPAASAFALAASFVCTFALAADQPPSPAPTTRPAPATKPASTVKRVEVEEFDKARQAKDAVVVDVRSPEEFAAGHIPGAVNVPVSGKGAEDFDKKVMAVAKDKTVLVHCRSGVRSGRAVERLRQMNVAEIIEFPKGWVAWSEAGKPVEKGAGAEKREK